MRDFTTPEQVELVYRRLARRYDRAARLLELLGLGYDETRREAVDALRLGRGDTVVDIGCGTGANFPLLEARVGPSGRIIGVDLTGAMLDEARKRIKAAGWANVDLVQCAAKDYVFPGGGVDGVLSTFALTLEPGYDAVIASIAGALRPTCRFAIADFKLSRGWALLQFHLRG